MDAGPDIKSPVRGTVKRLLVNTVGGVVQLGKEVAEIVPIDDALTVAGGRCMASARTVRCELMKCKY